MDNTELFTADKAYYCNLNPLQGTEQGKALPENDPDAHFFLVAEGGTIPLATAKRFGLVGKAKAEPEKEESVEEPKPRTRKKS